MHVIYRETHFKRCLFLLTLESSAIGVFVGPSLLSTILLKSIMLFLFIFFGEVGTIVCLRFYLILVRWVLSPLQVCLVSAYRVHRTYSLFFISVLPGGIKVPIFALKAADRLMTA